MLECICKEEEALQNKKPSRWSQQQDGKKGGFEMAFIIVKCIKGVWSFNGTTYPTMHKALEAAWKAWKTR